jgi:hypothetical protein
MNASNTKLNQLSFTLWSWFILAWQKNHLVTQLTSQILNLKTFHVLSCCRLPLTDQKISLSHSINTSTAKVKALSMSFHEASDYNFYYFCWPQTASLLCLPPTWPHHAQWLWIVIIALLTITESVNKPLDSWTWRAYATHYHCLAENISISHSTNTSNLKMKELAFTGWV